MTKKMRVYSKGGSTTAILEGDWTREGVQKIIRCYSPDFLYLNGEKIKLRATEQESRKREDEKEVSPEKLALQRFKEKSGEEKDRD